MTVRLLDRVIAAIGLVLLSPLLLVITIVVRISSPGPVLYRAHRVGRRGAPFDVLKFRSMTVDAESTGPALTQRGDRRITAVGRVLRRTKFDELPQLCNVVAGQMSIVGPRPEDPRYVAGYTTAQRSILEYPPGITSPASLHYRDEEQVLAASVASGRRLDDAYRELLAHKLAIDAAYMRSRTLASDARVVVHTLLGRLP